MAITQARGDGCLDRGVSNRGDEECHILDILLKKEPTILADD